MNFPDLRKLEDEICRKRVDCYDAISLLDAVLHSLGHEYENFPADLEHAYDKLIVELGKLDNGPRPPDEMDKARDFLIAQEEA